MIRADCFQEGSKRKIIRADMSQTMKAVVFKGPHKVVIEDRMCCVFWRNVYTISLHKNSQVLSLRSRKMET